MLTYKLNNGQTVIAKETKYGVRPVTYANRTQAQRKADQIGGGVYHPCLSRAFYVRIEEAQ